MINVNLGVKPENAGYSNERKVSGANEMIEIIRGVAETEFGRLAGHGLEPVDLLRAAPEHRFRRRDMSWNIGATVGRNTENETYNSVMAAVFDAKRMLREQQTNGDWCVCAWSITSRTVKKRFRSQKAPEELNTQRAAWNQWSGNPNPQQTSPRWVEDPKLVLTLVFVDALQSDEEDVWTERTGLKNSPMRKYVETKDLRFLSPSLRAERKAALELLESFCFEWFAAEMREDGGGKEPLPKLTELKDRAEDLGVDISDLGRKRRAIYERLQGAGGAA